MSHKRYLSAQEAADELGIQLATLYAYVSRGLIRSEETEGKSRAKQYRVEDIAALKSRKELQTHPAQAVEAALHFGEPILESAITLIANGRYYHRGHDALLLAQNHPFEEVASLLWLNSLNASDLFPAVISPLRSVALPPLPLIEQFQITLALAASDDLHAYDFSPLATAHTGARILTRLTQTAVAQAPSAPPQPASAPIAAILQAGWIPGQPEAIPLLNLALSLCADHELNVSSFTARCVASAGSTPYAVVQAGMAALQGHKHGGYTERVAALFQEAGTAANARATIASRLKRGEEIPGFGHRLYPDGDPRGQLLLAQVTAHAPQATAVALAHALIATTQQYPTVDFGLVTLSLALGLPPGAPLALFALGRTVGWIAQAIEQYPLDRLIRPRSRYTGPPIAVTV